MWAEFKKAIERFDSFILCTHVNPDGDGLGSELALASLLGHLGKKRMIVNPSETPANYRFLDLEGEILVYGPQLKEAVESCQAVVLLDVGSFKRLGELGALLKGGLAFKICVDHHLTVEDEFDLAIVQQEAAATGMMVFDLFGQLRVPLSGKGAQALYTAIMRETGSFRFSNTSPDVHRVVAQLLELGVNPQQVYEEVYEKSSAERLWLLGRLLSEMKVEREGQLAWTVATRSLMEHFRVPEADMDGFTDYPRALGSAKLVLLFLEKEGRVRISFRSKGDLDVNRMAASFGGGGHKNASGATVNGSLPEVMDKVLAACRAALPPASRSRQKSGGRAGAQEQAKG